MIKPANANHISRASSWLSKLPEVHDHNNQAELDNNRYELSDAENVLFHGARTNWSLNAWDSDVVDCC